MTDDDLEVVHNPQKSRFELEQDGLFCVLEYHLVEGKIVFTHTEVPEALGGRGLGSRLVRAGLDYARRQRLKIRPLCSFVGAYVQKHPEYQDLL